MGLLWRYPPPVSGDKNYCSCDECGGSIVAELPKEAEEATTEEEAEAEEEKEEEEAAAEEEAETDKLAQVVPVGAKISLGMCGCGDSECTTLNDAAACDCDKCVVTKVYGFWARADSTAVGGPGFALPAVQPG